MTVQLNHTIVWCQDKQKSAGFLVEVLGLSAANPFRPMLVVPLANGVPLDFYERKGAIASQHYAFLVGEDEFDEIFARICAKGLPYWADPGRRRSAEIYRQNGGRGFYFDDPDGHLLEVMTRLYEGGAC
jgi:catechol 2,3-dioxygenase-like lactoylglutathione lyase family enzyme